MERLATLARTKSILGVAVAGWFTSVSGVYAQPNQLTFTLVAPELGTSQCFQLPAVDEPVMVEGTQITLGWRGTGFVHATYSVAEGDPVLTWTGVHAEHDLGPYDAAIAGGYAFDGSPRPVVAVGFQSSSALETCPGDASSLRVHNRLNQSVTVVIKETW